MICHHCWDAIPDKARACPHCAQAAAPALRSPGSALGRRIDGCKFEPASPRDYRATPMAIGLPRQVDLRAQCSPIEDQGTLGSCAAHAACGALELQQKKNNQFKGPMSRLFVYYNARRMRGTLGQDSGVSIAEVMAALLAYGAPPENHWPYDVNAYLSEPPGGAYGAAKANQPAQYARVDGGGDGVQAALAHGLPVLFGFSLPERCFAEGGKTGLVPEPTAAERANAATDGGHAMLIVGYDLDKRTYLLRNSWGRNWGEAGYGRIPFQVMNDYVPPGDYWILGAIEANKAFRLTRPEAAPAGAPGKAQAIREGMQADLEKEMAEAQRAIRERFRK